jgi:hypothetical protein
MTEETTTTETSYELTMEEEAQQFVKEHNADGIVERLVKLEQRVGELQYAKDTINTRLQEQRQTNIANRDTVRNKFREMLDGDKNATIEMDLDDINELLSDIGASKIIFTYSVDVTVTATITGIEADSEEEARDKAIAALELRVDTDNLGEDANVEDEEYDADNGEEEDN